MATLFQNIRFFMQRMKRFDRRRYRSYWIHHVLFVLMSMASLTIGVLLPAKIVAIVMANGHLWEVLVRVLALALIQGMLLYFRNNTNMTETFMRMTEMHVGASEMMYFPAEDMQGALGEHVMDTTSKALYHGNERGFENYFRHIWRALLHLLTAIVFIVLSVRLSFWWMLLLLVPSLIKEWMKMGYYRLRDQYRDAEMDHFKRTSYYNRIILKNEAAKDIRLYHLVDLFRARQNDLKDDVLEWTDRLERRKMGYDLFGFVLFLVRDGVSILLLILALKQGMAVESFVLYLSLIPALGLAISQCFEAAVHVAGEQPRVTAFRHVLGLPHYDVGDYPKTMPDGMADVVFEDVSFSYGDTPVFKHLNLRIRPGEKLALVGGNGAGKTTLAKLVAGLLTPDEGRILIGGVDLQDVNPRDRYAYTTLIFQDVVLFAMTLAENVACETLDVLDRDRVWQALDDADLKSFVETLPNGLETHLTRYVNDDGMELSGGQKQRLVLARALYKGGHLLLLDEPTSALDPLAEAALYQEYLAFAKNRTTVFISHRLSSTQFCDRILFLEDGEIKEEGSHDDLMAKKGLYYDMFETQAKYYKDDFAGEVLS